jgi:hypothetical protein
MLFYGANREMLDEILAVVGYTAFKLRSLNGSKRKTAGRATEKAKGFQLGVNDRGDRILDR